MKLVSTKDGNFLSVDGVVAGVPFDVASDVAAALFAKYGSTFTEAAEKKAERPPVTKMRQVPKNKFR